MNPSLKPPSTGELQKLAEALAGGNVLAYQSYPDGRLVVINAQGQKLIFSPMEVKHAERRRKSDADVERH